LRLNKERIKQTGVIAALIIGFMFALYPAARNVDTSIAPDEASVTNITDTDGAELNPRALAPTIDLSSPTYPEIRDSSRVVDSVVPQDLQRSVFQSSCLEALERGSEPAVMAVPRSQREAMCAAMEHR
jgi:hypothetical protein